MKEYKHKVVFVDCCYDWPELQNAIDINAVDGWELVSVLSNERGTDSYTLIYKKEKY